MTADRCICAEYAAVTGCLHPDCTRHGFAPAVTALLDVQRVQRAGTVPLVVLAGMRLRAPSGSVFRVKRTHYIAGTRRADLVTDGAEIMLHCSHLMADGWVLAEDFTPSADAKLGVTP